MPRIAKLGLLVGSTLLVLYILDRLLPIIFPFVLGALLAAAIDPLVGLLERTHLSRGWATGLVLSLIILILGTSAAMLVGQLTVQIFELLQRLPIYYRDAINLANFLTSIQAHFTAYLPPSAHAILNNQLNSIYQEAISLLKNLLVLTFTLPGAFLDLAIAFVASFFMCRDKEKILAYLGGLIPDEHHGRARRIRAEVAISLLGFLRAQLILVFITAMGTTAGMYLLGVSYPLLIGLFAGLLDFLPYIGPSALFLPWLAYLVYVGSTAFAFKLALVWLGLGVLRQLFEARVVGDQMGIHPLTALIALYAGVQIFGPFGFIIGPVVAVILKAVIKADAAQGI